MAYIKFYNDDADYKLEPVAYQPHFDPPRRVGETLDITETVCQLLRDYPDYAVVITLDQEKWLHIDLLCEDEDSRWPERMREQLYEAQLASWREQNG